MMGVFERMRSGLYRFMYGRNGTDQLNTALLRLYIVLFIAQLVFNLLHLRIAYRICEAFFWVLLFFVLYRTFSKNLTRRQKENADWMNLQWRLRNNVANARARHADKEHRYFTCKECRTICRVPVGKGKIVITCPKCGAQRKAKT